MRLRTQRVWLPWLSIAILALLCAFLGVLQYRWTGEIAAAEKSRLQEELQARIITCSHAFNDDISSTLHGLVPAENQADGRNAEEIWSAQYLRWKAIHPSLLKSAGIEIHDNVGTRFLALDLQSGQLAPTQRPDTSNPSVFELRRMGSDQDRLLVELNFTYLRATLLPDMLNTCIANSGTPDYDIEVVTNGPPAALMYASLPNSTAIWDTADASAPLLDLRPYGPSGPPRPPPQQEWKGFSFSFHNSAGPPPFGGPGRWRLLARHKSGSLEALVARTQRRNLAVSAAVLLLILGTVAMLIRYSRQAQRLAELQMNFVTGVSHELRTPLTVIRTAAYNLRSPKFRRSEQHVERYGKMIEAESGKLEALVEQVMRFASANAGHVVRSREPVAIAELIEAEVDGVRGLMESRGVTLDERIEAELPVVMADIDALRQALRNLLDNALKYGVKNAGWIGVYARTVRSSAGDAAEIRIADKGPGIPAEEQRQIFDPFFRGRRAMQDQVHGTGLGLNLVKTIVEAHAGSVNVRSDASSGTEFVIRIPSAPPEFQTGAGD